MSHSTARMKVGSEQAHSLVRMSPWRSVVRVALASVGLIVALLIANVCHYNLRRRAPLDPDHWRTSRRMEVASLFGFVPSRRAMAYTLVERGQLLGIHRSDLSLMLTAPGRSYNLNSQSSQDTTILGWLFDCNLDYNTLYVAIDAQGIVADAWIGDAWNHEDRLTAHAMAAR